MTKRIVIVGGGYLGAELAKSVVRAKAMHIEADGVTLEDRSKVPADYIVVATGSMNASPFKPKSDDIGDFRAKNADIAARLRTAKTVAIVGAGAVGTELAGEIAHAMPDKQVSLICADSTLFPSMPAKLGRDLQRKLAAMGVKLVTSARAENLESQSEPYAGTLKLSNEATMTADLIFPVIGSRASSELLSTLPGAMPTTAGRIKTDPWMRPSALPNVFAAGDVADSGDAMTVVAVSRQLPWLKKLLLAAVAGKPVERRKPYRPWNKAPILVPLGPKLGSSFLLLFTAGNFMTRMMKGKDLFLTKYNKLLGR